MEMTSAFILMSQRTSKTICIQSYYVHWSQACISKAAQTGCTQIPYWGHPLCSDKASFRSLLGRHYSCQPMVDTSFRVEGLLWDLQLESRRWWSSALGSGAGGQRPPETYAHPTNTGSGALYPGEDSDEKWRAQQIWARGRVPQLCRPLKDRCLQHTINILHITAETSCCV